MADEHIPTGLELYFTRNRDGSFSIVDMVSKKPAVAGEIPDFITASSYYNSGIKKLKKHAKRIQLSVWFGRHKKGNDLGGSELLSATLQETDLYIPESIYWEQDSMNVWNKIACAAKPRSEKTITKIIEDLRYTPDDGFARSLILAVAGSKVPVRFIDYTTYDFKDIPGLEAFDDARYAYSQSHDWVAHDAFYWEATFNFYREWIMVANLGDVLDKFVDPISKQPLRVLITIGAFHQDLILKLRKFGIEPTITYPHASEEVKRVFKQEAAILAKYQYTPDDLSLYRGLSEIRFSNTPGF